MLAGVVVAVVIAVQERIIGCRRRRGKFTKSCSIGRSIKPKNRGAIVVGAPVTAVVTRWVLQR